VELLAVAVGDEACHSLVGSNDGANAKLKVVCFISKGKVVGDEGFSFVVTSTVKERMPKLMASSFGSVIASGSGDGEVAASLSIGAVVST
jgi:hypothetical protein